MRSFHSCWSASIPVLGKQRWNQPFPTNLWGCPKRCLVFLHLRGKRRTWVGFPPPFWSSKGEPYKGQKVAEVGSLWWSCLGDSHQHLEPGNHPGSGLWSLLQVSLWFRELPWILPINPFPSYINQNWLLWAANKNCWNRKKSKTK